MKSYWAVRIIIRVNYVIGTLCFLFAGLLLWSLFSSQVVGRLDLGSVTVWMIQLGSAVGLGFMGLVSVASGQLLQIGIDIAQNTAAMRTMSTSA